MNPLVKSEKGSGNLGREVNTTTMGAWLKTNRILIDLWPPFLLVPRLYYYYSPISNTNPLATKAALMVYSLQAFLKELTTQIPDKYHIETEASTSLNSNSALTQILTQLCTKHGNNTKISSQNSNLVHSEANPETIESPSMSFS